MLLPSDDRLERPPNVYDEGGPGFVIAEATREVWGRVGARVKELARRLRGSE